MPSLEAPIDVLEALAETARASAIERGLDPGNVNRILGTLGNSTASQALEPEEFGPCYERLLAGRGENDADRKLEGRYYTLDALAAATVRHTLDPLLSDHRSRRPEQILALRIADPAVGGGAFLLAALTQLSTSLGASLVEHGWLIDSTGTTLGPAAPEWFAHWTDSAPSPLPLTALCARCVGGIDSDRGAVRVARLALWLRCADPRLDPPRDLRIVHGDALVDTWTGAATVPPPPSAPDPVGWQTHFADALIENGGFDAVVGNPPWEIRKPDSRAFFERVDPSFRRLTKQEAISRQRELTAAQPDLAASWNEHRDRTRALNRWFRSVGEPFTHQGRTGDANSYKLFLDLAWHLLRPDGGRLGMIVPSGLYSDLGCTELRRLFLDRSRWDWLFSFENRDGVFPIDGRFKFCPIVVTKGGRTERVRAAFLRRRTRDWDSPDAHAVDLPRTFVERFSPDSLAFPDVQDARTLDVLDRIHTSAATLDDWGASVHRELDLTNDSVRFATLEQAAAAGFVPDQYSRWVRLHDDSSGDDDESRVTLRDGRVVPTAAIAEIAVPVWEGRMIGAHDDGAKAWVEGRGRRARWSEPAATDADPRPLGPQYVVRPTTLPSRARQRHGSLRLGYMAIASATNTRSMLAAPLPTFALCGNSVPTVAVDRGGVLALAAITNSLVFDFALRARLAGVNLNWFVFRECPLPRADLIEALPELGWAAARLGCAHVRFADTWIDTLAALPRAPAWQAAWWPRDTAERRTIEVAVQAVVAALYQLEDADVARIVAECDRPTGDLARPQITSRLDPKGFWRVDRTHVPTDRLPVRFAAAFARLADSIRRHGDRIGACRTFLRRYALPRLDREDADASASWVDCARHAERLRAP